MEVLSQFPNLKELSVPGSDLWHDCKGQCYKWCMFNAHWILNCLWLLVQKMCYASKYLGYSETWLRSWEKCGWKGTWLESTSGHFPMHLSALIKSDHITLRYNACYEKRLEIGCVSLRGGAGDNSVFIVNPALSSLLIFPPFLSLLLSFLWK